MQQKNLIAFMIVSMLLLSGWMYLQQQAAQNAQKQRLAEQKALAEKKEKEAAVIPRLKEAVVAGAAVLSGASPMPLLPLAALGEQQRPPALSPPPPEVVQRPREIQFGEDLDIGTKDFFIKAVLTTKGAAVKRLILNKFEGADRLGEPTHKPLELIPEDKYAPSFCLYHFPKVDSERPDNVLGQITWKFEGETKPDTAAPLEKQVHEVRFSATIPDANYSHVKINKTYTLAARDYHIGLSLNFEDTRTGKGDAQPLRYQLAGSRGLPIEGWWYTYTYRNALIGEVDKRNNLWRNFQDSRTIVQQGIGDRIPTGALGDNFLQYAGVAVQYFSSMIVVDNKQADGMTMSDVLAWARPTVETQERAGRIVAMSKDRTNVVLMDRAGERLSLKLLPRTITYLDETALKEGENAVATFYTAEQGLKICTWLQRGTLPQPHLNDITMRVNSQPVDLEPGESITHNFLLYHGPNKVRLLSQMGDNSPADALVERYADTLHLRTLTDYQSPGWIGSFSQAIRLTDLLIAITSLMHGLIYMLRHVTPGYGWTIILLTIVVRGLMYPISRRQAVLSIRMQALAPEMKKIQEKYKNDPQGRNQAVMDLYRKHNVHPFGMCLPLVLQMPIFLGLYYALQESVHLRLASFLRIPNLAAPDMTLYWTESIPVISEPDSHGGVLYLGPYLNILPIAAVALMVIHQKLFTPPPADEQQEATQRMMKYMMIFFGIMFYKIAAGLCIYFIASSLWGLAERQLLPKKQPTPASGPTPPTEKKAKQSTVRKLRPGDQKPKDSGAFQRMKDWWAEVLEQARKK